jgi:hypothetical protein
LPLQQSNVVLSSEAVSWLPPRRCRIPSQLCITGKMMPGWKFMVSVSSLITLSDYAFHLAAKFGLPLEAILGHVVNAVLAASKGVTNDH